MLEIIKQRIITTHPITGDSVEFVSTTSENDGTCNIMHVRLNPTFKVPSQYHKKTIHVFKCLEGALCIRLKGGELEMLPAGRSFTILPLTPYALLNPGLNLVKFEHKIIPGRRGFEDALMIFHGMLKKKELVSFGTRSFLNFISDTYTVSFTEKMLHPLRRYLASKALRDGAYKNLLEKYGRANGLVFNHDTPRGNASPDGMPGVVVYPEGT
ncbi:cupin domain-containing protein [Litoribacter alkaliphilus]|uniref:Cupin domain-containing protein n=1 Tax=Litoribacter ruber TaxID=702568 RepID=A0AAP2G3W1_9BACT|nr:cupin domain-containing protein [Litoribacter alkaliphilus]MBS9523895.1 cupin domain-containing protein [Litoribacter alkaliphilus]